MYDAQFTKSALADADPTIRGLGSILLAEPAIEATRHSSRGTLTTWCCRYSSLSVVTFS